MSEELAPATVHATADAEQQQTPPNKRRPGAQPMVGDREDTRSPQNLFEAWYLKSGANAHGLKPSVKMARRAWTKMLPPRASAMTTKWCRSYWERQCAANLAARHGQAYVASDRVRKTDDGKCVSLADLVRQISGSDRGERGRTIVAKAIAGLESAGWHFARKRAESSRRERVVDLGLLAPLISALTIVLADEPERASVAAYWGSTAHATLLLGRQGDKVVAKADRATPTQPPYGLDMQFAAASVATVVAPASAILCAEPAASTLRHARTPLPAIMPYDLRPQASKATTHPVAPQYARADTLGQCGISLHRGSLRTQENVGHDESSRAPDNMRSTASLGLGTAREQTRTGGNDDDNNCDNPIWLDDDDGNGTSFKEALSGAIELDLNDPPPPSLRDDIDGGAGGERGNGHVKVESKDETDKPRDSTKRKRASRDDAKDEEEGEGTETEDEDAAWTDAQSGPPSPIEVDYPPTKPSDLLGLCLKKQRTAFCRASKADGTDGRTKPKSKDATEDDDDEEGRWRVWRNVRM